MNDSGSATFRRSPIRLLVPWLVLGLILFGRFEPFFFRLALTDRAPLSQTLRELPYRKIPGLRELLFEARARSAIKDSVAVFSPADGWYEGYEYAYARALYVLAGREVLPLMNIENQTDYSPMRSADWILCIDECPPVEGTVTVWRGRGGEILERRP